MLMADSPPLRSLLFAPGNRARMLEKVGTFGADAVVIDLEDAVPIAEKEATRATVRAALETYRWPCAFVRVNTVDAKTVYSKPFGTADIAAVVCPWLAGIMVPKVESPHEVQAADTALAEAERKAGLPEGSIELVPLLETALGVTRAYELAGTSPRIRRISFGAGDFTTDLGVPWTSDGTAYFVARSLVVIAARANRREALDTVFADIKDLAGLERDARLGCSLGCKGKVCIHPTQVAVVNAVYTPSAEELAEARRFVAAFDAATRAGQASIMIDGILVDYANAERYRRLVATATPADSPGP